MPKSIMIFAAMLYFLCLSSFIYAQSAVLEGFVADSENGNPLVGANIVLTTEGDLRMQGASTNNDGEFVLGGISPEIHTVTISYLGYESVVFENESFSAGESKHIEVAMVPGVFEAEQIIVTASLRHEKMLDAPASVSVIERRQIQNRQTMTPIDHLIGLPGVDIVKSGLNQANVVVRGFNNVFSGTLLSIVDNRIARVPSVRYNAYNFIPTSNEDIERMEIVRGPGSALYGPNSANGVLHMITRSPFGSEGTSLSVSGGERSLFMASFRHAGSNENKVGYKLSANYSRGEDFKYVDPAEIVARNFNVEKLAVDGRLDFRVSNDMTFILNGGLNRATSIELTGVGAAQADDWTYSYVQGKMLYKRLFMQAFVNMSDAGDSKILRQGNSLIDKSKLYVYQLQHGTSFGGIQTFTYGFDGLWTRPDTEMSINGMNEDDDEINEYGVYLQSETQLSEELKVVLAGRLDDHSRLKDPFFSPRAGLVIAPNPTNTFRFTFNRSFSTPTANNLFLDLNASPERAPNLAIGDLGQPFNVQLRGVPETGFTFGRDSNGLGGLYMQAILPDQSVSFLPADATLLWPVIVGLFAQQGIDISALPAPASANVSTVLRNLNTTTLQFDAVTPDFVTDIKPMESTKNNTFEVGYKGILGGKLLANIDVYYSEIKDFVGPLRVETPSVFYDPVTLTAYLSNFLSAANAQDLAALIARIPVGTIKPDQTVHPGDLMLTYRNFGDIDLYGTDLGLTYYVNPNWNISGSYSYVSKDFFEEDPSDIALNAPKNKVGLMLNYDDSHTGFNGQIRYRWVDNFPVNSGVYIGNVDSYSTIDLTAGVLLPSTTRTKLSISVQNLFDNKHIEMVGAPEIGRLGLVRLMFTF